MKNLKANWYLWLFPVLAVALTGWLFWDYLQQVGPKIEITFDEGSSIKPDKTQIRFRGVQIGIVTDVVISENKKNVVVHARLNRNAKEFATEGSKFWIETPKISIEGISGLGTLVDGSYIATIPGPEDAETQTKFAGKSGNDMKNPLEDTASFYLDAGNVESVSDGDSVRYRGMVVGSVTKVTLSKTAQRAVVQLSLPYQHMRLIRTNTVFWRKTGVQAKLGLFNSEIKVNSFDSILRGGVEFATPDAPGEKAKAGTHFQLLDDAPKEWKKWNPSL